MTFEEILTKAKKVRRIGPRKAAACCEAHDDKRPSLSIKEADGKTLVHCFAGCTPQAICSAMGIDMADLFVEPKGKRKQCKNDHQKLLKTPIVSPFHTTKLLRQYANKLWDIADAYHLQSSRVLEQAQGLAIDDWTSDELDRALDIVARAKQKQQLVMAIDNLAGALKTSAMDLERKHYASRPRKTR